MDYYTSQVIWMATSYKRDFTYMAPCEGQTLLIQQYPALYSIIGMAYGGDGKTTFGVPDMRPVENGQKRNWHDNELIPYIVINGDYPLTN